jgi:hypothetical protein
MGSSDKGLTSSTESRALALLGAGVGPENVANATGVSISRISQLLSDETFAAQVAELRFENLQKHNLRDSEYDSLEDDLIERLKDLIPLMLRPMEVLKAIQVINAAKRRGASTPEAITAQQTVVPLVLPTVIINKFTTNTYNQVVQTGEQNLVTMQSGTLMDRLKESKGLLNERSLLTAKTEGPA